VYSELSHSAQRNLIRGASKVHKHPEQDGTVSNRREEGADHNEEEWIRDGHIDPESIEWELIVASQPWDMSDRPNFSEDGEQQLHSQKLSFRTIVKLLSGRYPTIPNFGLFHLNIAEVWKFLMKIERSR
jgi:hypothetical protein